VHANQPGTFLYEVQQSSDTTLRLYDWDRNDPGRPLHIDESLRVLDMSIHDRHRIPAVVLDSAQGIERKLRIACRYFAIEELRFTRSAEILLEPKGSFRVMTVLDGSIDVSHDAGRDRIGKGRTVLFPACLRTSVATGDAGSHFLISWVPDLAREIVDPLRRQGTPDSDIELLGGNALRNDLLPLLKG
jgi:mannose-6-phosphate isomerase